MAGQVEADAHLLPESRTALLPDSRFGGTGQGSRVELDLGPSASNRFVEVLREVFLDAHRARSEPKPVMVCPNIMKGPSSSA